VEVLESLHNLAKLDAVKRNIMDSADNNLYLPLHHTARYHPDPDAIKLLVCYHPPALLAKDTHGVTPLGHAIESNKSPAVKGNREAHQAHAPPSPSSGAAQSCSCCTLKRVGVAGQSRRSRMVWLQCRGGADEIPKRAGSP